MAEAAFVTVEVVTPKPGGKSATVGKIVCASIASRETPILTTELLAAAEKTNWRLAVDFTDVGMITSVGIGMLVTLHNKTKAGKGMLTLFGMRPEIAELLKLTRLDRMFTIVKDRSAAMQALS